MKEETKCYCGHTTYCDCGPEEPKQETIKEPCVQCCGTGEIQKSTNRKQSNFECDLCDGKGHWNKVIEPKQETLEEVAERIYPTDCTNWSIKVPLNERKAFVEGAKWQQERSYSEEEVEDFIYKVCGTVARLQGITLNGNHIDTAYKQFKKK